MSQIITTPLGKIEFEIQGTGPHPVLILHGSPGGIDAARAMSRFLLLSPSSPSPSPSDRDQKFKCILLSRPGYLGTPLSHLNRSIDAEADLLAATLDSLKISRVGVLAWSGGGPAAYRLAVRHPDKVGGMVMISAVSHRWVAPEPDWGQKLMFGTGFGGKVVEMLCRVSPAQVVGGALEGEGRLRGEGLRRLVEGTMGDEEQRRLVLEVAKTVNTGGRRREGWRNDVRNFGEIESLELERVGCPVLLVHGEGDTDAEPEHSRFADGVIRDSRLVMMEEGTHLAFYAHPRAREVQELAREWLSRLAGSIWSFAVKVI